MTSGGRALGALVAGVALAALGAGVGVLVVVRRAWPGAVFAAVFLGAGFVVSLKHEPLRRRLAARWPNFIAAAPALFGLSLAGLVGLFFMGVAVLSETEESMPAGRAPVFMAGLAFFAVPLAIGANALLRGPRLAPLRMAPSLLVLTALAGTPIVMALHGERAWPLLVAVLAAGGILAFVWGWLAWKGARRFGRVAAAAATVLTVALVAVALYAVSRL